MDVSVIIPALNAEKTVARAVESALVQTLRNIEVIVVDDGSKDATSAVVAGLSARDPRVRLIQHDERQGVSASRNDAIMSATGEWIAVLDADDWFGPLRLARMLDHARRNGLDGVIDNLTRVDADTGEVLGDAFPARWLSTTQPIPPLLPLELDIPYHQKGMGFGYCKPLLKRTMFINTVGSYDTRFRCGEDLYALQNYLFAGARVGTIAASEYHYSVDRKSHSNASDAYLHISNVNRALVAGAESRGDSIAVSFLRERQIVIDYVAFMKAINNRSVIDTVRFGLRVPLKNLWQQVIRRVGRRFGYDFAQLDPRDRRWLKHITTLSK